jgi:nicotinate-nucleotide pyrophosphorylase (carboxylating)
MTTNMNNIKSLIRLALSEDIGPGDATSEAIIPKGLVWRARVIAKEDMILAGGHIATAVFKTVDKKIAVKLLKKDGARLKKGAVIMTARGPARSLLAAERTALNFLQRLSGIATLTGRFVSLTKGSGIKILDTRKTTPGLRLPEKYAVHCGGGTNHRMGLYDMYLIKNNHVDIAGSVTEAVLAVRSKNRSGLLIEVEVRNFRELEEAVISGADTVMLDNFGPKMAQKAVKIVQKLSKTIKFRPKIEISGGISLKNIKKHAKTGADFISVGALTHSAIAVDICMRVK